MAKSSKPKTEERVLGWIPDLPDARDFIYAAPLKVMLKLPAKIDLRKTCSPVFDQKHLGSCTANALTAAVEFGKKKQKKKVARLSRLFLYYNERVMMNTVLSDSGAYLRDGIKSLNKKGVCPEKEWPYVEAKFSQKPPAECYRSALNNQIISYSRIPVNITSIKGCLAEGYPFAFGFAVYESFMTQKVKQTGIMPLPNISQESLLGGHAVLAVGYNDVKQAVLVRNSWGTGWGILGYFWMPYSYISNDAYCQDFWTVREVE